MKHIIQQMILVVIYRKIIVRNVYTHSNQIFDTYKVKQKIKKKDIEWTFYKRSKGKFSFPKKNICDCP